MINDRIDVTDRPGIVRRRIKQVKLRSHVRLIETILLSKFTVGLILLAPVVGYASPDNGTVNQHQIKGTILSIDPNDNTVKVINLEIDNQNSSLTETNNLITPSNTPETTKTTFQSPESQVPTSPQQLEDSDLKADNNSDNTVERSDVELPNSPDPELGDLILRELEPPKPPKPKYVYVRGELFGLASDNLFSLNIDPIGESLWGLSFGVTAVPPLGKKTNLIGALGGAMARYRKYDEADYNTFYLNAGVRHELFKRTYGELGWVNRHYYTTDGDEFLDDNAVYLYLSRRDPLVKNLNLNTFYQLRFSFADPDDRSQMTNALGATLAYDISPSWQTSLNYQVFFSNFTEQDRNDIFNQVFLRFYYQISKSTYMEAFGGYNFGNSTDDDIDFNGGILGITFGFNFGL